MLQKKIKKDYLTSPFQEGQVLTLHSNLLSIYHASAVSSEVNSKYFASTSEQTEKNKMASRFASVIEEQILSILKRWRLF